jgi:hypothetical protein
MPICIGMTVWFGYFSYPAWPGQQHKDKNQRTATRPLPKPDSSGKPVAQRRLVQRTPVEQRIAGLP